MKIAYVANARIPTEKAHGLQIMKTCEALFQAGEEVTLIVPTRRNNIKVDPFDYYKIKTRFPIVYLKNADFINFGFLGYALQSFLFARKIHKYLQKSSADVVFGRDEMILCVASSVKPVVWETHTGALNFWAKELLKKAKGIIAITQGLRDFYVSNGLNAEKISVIADAVDISEFDIAINKIESREKLGLPQDKKLAIYTGHLYEWKGTGILARATKFLPENFLVVFVGGTEKDIGEFKKIYENEPKIKIIGHESHEKIPMYLRAADVLVVPNTAKDTVSRLYTSPMKVFEYMASGTPIVASDLPSIREVLNESNAFLVASDDPEALSKGITQAISAEGQSRATQARLDVENYSWQKRAEKIIGFCKKTVFSS